MLEKVIGTSMLETVFSLVRHGQLRFETGRVILLSQRIAMLPTYNFGIIQKNLEKNGAENELYFGAKDMGKKWFTLLNETYKIKREDVFEWGIKIIGLSGWGIVKTIKTDPKTNFWSLV